MKERPILFSTDSVRAILDVRKSQTRRVIKQQIKKELYPGELLEYCPYGQVGDLLWVRETWRTITDKGTPNDFGIVYKDGGINFFRDNANIMNYPMNDRYNQPIWRPSIFMPRWASRITLEITEVRIERLQEITEEDAGVEGIVFEKYQSGVYPWALSGVEIEQLYKGKGYRIEFHKLWDSLNAKRGYGWETNPWVWVIGFKVVK